jgi:hypothetical protein
LGLLLSFLSLDNHLSMFLFLQRTSFLFHWFFVLSF